MQNPDFSAIWLPNERPLKLPDADKFANKNSMRCVVAEFARKLSGGPLQNGQGEKAARASGGESSAQGSPGTHARFLSCQVHAVSVVEGRRVGGLLLAFNVVLVPCVLFLKVDDDWRRTDGWVCLKLRTKDAC
jgi:hypothetical protein